MEIDYHRLNLRNIFVLSSCNGWMWLVADGTDKEMTENWLLLKDLCQGPRVIGLF